MNVIAINLNSVTAQANLLLAEYRLSLEAANRSLKTISWYMDILHKFFTFVDSKKPVKLISDIDSKELRAYVLHRQTTTKWASSPRIKKIQGKLSPFSIQGDVRAIKAFWSWLYAEDYIDKNPLAKFPLPKVPINIVKTLTIDQLKQLLKAVDRATPVGSRNYCILMLLIDAGPRISEVVSINMKDLDLLHCIVKVLGKGQKEREFPFSPATRKELMRYLKYFRGDLCELESS